MLLIRKFTPYVFAFLSLAFAAYYLVTTVSSNGLRNPSDEMVSKWEDHVQSLREALPFEVTQVGYIDDAALSGHASLFDANEFQLMQYSVAPVVLQMGTGHEWIIGNFSGDDNLAAWLNENMSACEVQSFGFGLYLIHDLEN